MQTSADDAPFNTRLHNPGKSSHPMQPSIENDTALPEPHSLPASGHQLGTVLGSAYAASAGGRRSRFGVTINRVSDLGVVREEVDALHSDVQRRGAVTQMLNEFLLGPEKLVDVGTECPSAGFRVLPDRFGIGDAPTEAEFDVDVSQRVDVPLEVTAEDSDLRYEQRHAGVGVVFPDTVVAKPLVPGTGLKHSAKDLSQILNTLG